MSAGEEQNDTNEPPPEKKARTDENRRPKKSRGLSKNRPFFKQDIGDRLCRMLINGRGTDEKCTNERCRKIHDIDEFLKERLDDIGNTCYIYSTKGYCKFGVTCRFGRCHLDDSMTNIGDSTIVNDKNLFSGEVVNKLRKKKYNFTKADAVLKEVQQKMKNSGVKEDVDTQRDNDVKQIDFKNKLYLSPLTTVGNLPFRRICKTFGADITCGEMACSVPLINAHFPEWALTKRHESEDLFGIQICGHSAKLNCYATEVIAQYADFDFIDLNIGCPIDLIYKQGAGSALLRRPHVLEETVRACSTLLAQHGKVFTVKTRTGVYADKSVAHEFIPKFEEWGSKLTVLHGRSREQRYQKLADYDYIEQCAQKAKNMPVFGNGDIMSFQDYQESRAKAPHISGVMIGRGALIKPWIFQEIKEQKSLDLSSGERLDMLRTYVNYGLEHWGSDTKGVENTRRFLLEWLSFLYRYVPYGLLERPPQKINQRPDNFRGRDDLETLMASPNSNDWVRISEMLLGKVPDGFAFVPKHKANSFAVTDDNTQSQPEQQKPQPPEPQD